MKVATVRVRRPAIPLGNPTYYLYSLDLLEGSIFPGDYFFGERVMEYNDHRPFFHNIIVNDDPLVGTDSIVHIEHRLPGIPDGAEDITKAEAAATVSDVFWSLYEKHPRCQVLRNLATHWSNRADFFDPDRLPF